MSKKLDALIFDFDGLILDTETPEFDVLQQIYAEYDVELSLEKWGKIIGGSGAVEFVRKTVKTHSLNGRCRTVGIGEKTGERIVT